jgi:hypothetical protein
MTSGPRSDGSHLVTGRNLVFRSKEAIYMDKRLEGVPLKVVEAGATLTLSTNTTNYRYRGIANPNHTCREQNHLKVGDMVVVQRVAPNKDMLVKGPCGCNYLLYDLVGEPPHVANSGAPAWDNLLDRVRQWMIVRFALNTEHDLWGWLFVIGAAAHMEYLAVAVLWVADQKPTPFNEYQPKKTLGQAARLIRDRGLLDPDTVETLEGIAELRNSVAHRGATYSIPFREGDPSRGEYKGRHVFTDLEGLAQLIDDMDAATKVMGEWLRKADLGTNEGAPALGVHAPSDVQ